LVESTKLIDSSNEL